MVLNLKNYQQYLIDDALLSGYRQKLSQFLIDLTSGRQYSIYVISPDDDTNYYALEYLYLLTKSRYNLDDITMDLRGELYYRFDPEKELVILICSGFEKELENELLCLNKFKNLYSISDRSGTYSINNQQIFTFSNI